MSRNLKTLGLALVAVFALSATMASAASAHVFKASQYPAHLTGIQEEGAENYLEITGSEERVECEVATYSGTVEGETEEVTVQPVYEECFAPGLSPEPGSVPVDTEGCHFTLTGETDANGHAIAHVTCEGTSTIKITAPGCTLEIGTQTPEGGAHYTTTTNPETGKEDVTVMATSTGVEYSASGSLCFLVAGNGEDGDFHSAITVQGYSDPNHTNPIDVTTTDQSSPIGRKRCAGS